VQAIIAQQRLSTISRNRSATKSDGADLVKEVENLLKVDEAVR
jgi:hypothetical protein